MKNLILSVVVFAIFSISPACSQQKKHVPEAVKTAFAKKFPNAKKIKWGQEDAKEWEAEFKMNGKDYSANFDNKGSWKETEYEINESEIPASVKNTIETQFEDYKIGESEISKTVSGKVYEFKIVKGENKMELVVSPDGKVLNKEVKKQDKEGNEENDSEDND